MNLKLPKIKLGKITLREIEEADYLDLFYIGSKMEVCKYLNWGPYKNPNEALFTIREIFLKRPDDGLPIGYSIIMDNKMIGEIDFHTYKKNENSMEIGYFLDPSYWGLGIIRKCIKKMLSIGFNQLGLDKIVLGSLVENERSINTIINSNFKYEYEKMIDMGEEYKLSKYYSFYKSDFKEE